MKIRQVGAELFHADGQTDRRKMDRHKDRREMDRQRENRHRDRRKMNGQAVMTQLIVTFRNFANALKIKSEG
jgi:hypothetical protein